MGMRARILESFRAFAAPGSLSMGECAYLPPIVFLSHYCYEMPRFAKRGGRPMTRK